LVKEAVQKLRLAGIPDQLHPIEEPGEPLNEVNLEKTASEEKNTALN
jgi:hypothetical protein